MINQASLDELLVSAAEKPASKTLEKLLAEIRKTEGAVSPETANQLNLLWESWDGENLDPAAANFCIEIAALSIPGSAAFRAILADAVRVLLPPYLSRTPFMRALGLRDESTPTNEIVWRFRKLASLKNGQIIFRAGSWGIAGVPDSISGSLPVAPYGSRGSAAAVPMELILKDAVFLSPGLDVNKITDPVKAAAMSSAEYRNMVKRLASSSVSDTQLRNMAQSSVGKKMTPEEFNAWWSAETASLPAGIAGGRRACDGRSVAEIDLLLDKEAAAGAGKFNPEEAAILAAFFTNLKPEAAVREAKTLAGVVSKICARTAEADRLIIFTPLRGKAPFWPENPDGASLTQLAVWGELAAKDLGMLAVATATVFDCDYLSGCVLRLPLKALNAVCAAVPDDVLHRMLASLKSCYSDLLLWVWKNRKTLNPELLALVNIENVVRALSIENLPKAWGPAQRELRAALLDKADFQKQLIASSGDNAAAIAATLQGALFLSPGERQSLLVKLSRHSDALRDHIENGAGQRILNAGLKSTDAKIAAPPENNLTFTSIKSHQRLLKELSDIVNIHVPENREALKIARAHGDFRENAEFDAAKERRNYLSRRRTELERELTRIQPVSFRNVSIEDTAVIGCKVTLLDPEDGEQIAYCLLGAWDGAPEKNHLSYMTRLGQAILNHKVGETIEMPNSSKRIIHAIEPLPEAVIAEME